VEIVRLARPSLAEFQTAGEICELRWPFLRALHTRERFEALQRLGVELVVARDGGRMDGVCFALPCRYELGGETVEWASLFHLATRPETKNIGALMMMRLMSLYPAVVSIGVTDEATRLYVALRWKRYDGLWRGVHPVDMKLMAAAYVDRLHQPWQRFAFRALSGVYNVAGSLAEAALSWGVPCRQWEPSSTPDSRLAAKGALMATYLGMFSSGKRTSFVDWAGVGRGLNSFPEGWGGLREHARIWREFRRRGVKLCEVLATTPEAKVRLLRLGYVPMAMPMWYVDKNGMAGKLIEALKRNEISYFHLDKSI